MDSKLRENIYLNAYVTKKKIRQGVQTNDSRRCPVELSKTRVHTFDFILTIAMGSAFGRILTAHKVSIAETLTTFPLLIGLQYLLSFFEVRSSAFSKLITSRPTLLFYNGNFLEKVRKKDLLGAVRKKRFSSLLEVEAIILETDGNFSVLKKSASDQHSSYQDLLEIQDSVS